MNGMMHALRLHEPGGPEQLVYEEAPIPFVGIGDALIRVHAASFTPTELGWPSTWVDHAGHDRQPIIPAHEVSGTVTALGYGTTGVSIGDEVYGLTDWYRDGAAAEHVAVEARNLAAKPTSLTHVEAAAVPLAALTAWQGLFDHGHLKPGQRVLIHGAGGGVGTFAVQLAHHGGARVVATGHEGSRQLVTQLAAAQYIDVDRERFEEVTADVDLVFDLVGGDTLRRSWSVVKPGGALVSVVEEPKRDDTRPDVQSAFFVVQSNRSELDDLSLRLDGGKLRPIVGQVFPLAQGREAFQAKRNPGVPGKIVLDVAGLPP